MKCLQGPFLSGNRKHNRVLHIQHPTGATGFYEILRDSVPLYNVHNAYSNCTHHVHVHDMHTMSCTCRKTGSYSADPYSSVFRTILVNFRTADKGVNFRTNTEKYGRLAAL